MCVGALKDPEFYWEDYHDDDNDGGIMKKMTGTTVTLSPNKTVNL